MFVTLLPLNVAPVYSYVANAFLYNLYITVCICMYSYVLVWCFSHDQKTSVTEKVLSLNERRKFTSLNRTMNLF